MNKKQKSPLSNIERALIKKTIEDRGWDIAKAFFENRWLTTSASRLIVGEEVADRQIINNRKMMDVYGKMIAFYTELLHANDKQVEAWREMERGES